MYTECPDCRTTFRLSAQILRQAKGQVRCGGCGKTFNAIEHLSEELPGDEPSPTQTMRAFDEQSRELLESLDQLAGRDVARIEDTGVEWRVLDVEDASDNDDGDAPPATGAGTASPDDTGIRWTLEEPGETSAADNDGDDTVAQPLDDDAGDGIPVLADAGEAASQAALDLRQDAPDDSDEPMRFDDHTPLPDDFYKPSEQPGFREAAAPADDADADADARAEATQADLALDVEDDWEDLLAEVGDETGNKADEKADQSGASDETGEAASQGDAGARADEAADTRSQTSDDDEDHAGDVSIAADDAVAGDADVLEPDDDSAAARASDDEAGVADDTEDEDDELARSMAMEIDQELLRAAAESPGDADEKAEPARPGAADDSQLVETIIMEGDTVTDLLMEAEQATLDADIDPVPDDEEVAAAQVPDRKRRNLGIAAVVVLGIALAAQLVHANRSALATWDGFEATLGPVYRVFGEPVTPAWDVRGWQFESTSGSTDAGDQRLTIHSRIANRGDQPLPYPLVHVALTDRFEEVVGSRILTPAEYLAGSGSPGRPVAPGASFTAVIAVDAPSPDATGFKLNVCYSVKGDAVRCAIEDFRD